jgi:hypothetical protein
VFAKGCRSASCRGGGGGRDGGGGGGSSSSTIVVVKLSFEIPTARAQERANLITCKAIVVGQDACPLQH